MTTTHASTSREVIGGSGGGTADAWDVTAADDPTDWTGDFKALQSLDASLRCDLCFDIYTAPVAIKECHHTFCSSCIRSAINKPGEEMGSRCPKCMNKNVYDSTLLPQPTLEHAAQQWRTARRFLFEQMNRTKRLEEMSASRESEPQGRKRARQGSESKPVSPSSSPTPVRRRSARSLSARNGGNAGTAQTQRIVIDDSSSSEVETEQEERGASKDYRSMQANDLVQCPLCTHTFTMRMLNVHLDKGTCKPGDPEPTPQERGLTATSAQPARSSGSTPGTFFGRKPAGPSAATPNGQSPTPPRMKLVRLNYDLCKPVELKRSLDEWRLPLTGERKRLIERHRKWVNLFNANLDASETMRKTDKQLRQELSAWERSLGATSNLTEKRVKTWAVDHKDEFARLTAQARGTHVRDKGKHDGGDGVASEGGERETGEADEQERTPDEQQPLFNGQVNGHQ